MSKLIPIPTSEMVEKTVLVVATVEEYLDSIKFTAAQFNRINSDYTVVIKDYSNGKTLNTEAAITRLNTDIISGKYPDLIHFSNSPPFAYINKGYLLDLYPFIDSDDQLQRADLITLDKLEKNNGIYYLSSTFNIETLAGLYSRFGDRTGWTLDEYLAIEKNLPDNVAMISNNTRLEFLRQISARYLKTAINWDTGKCNFNNETLKSILKSISQIRETPEDSNSQDFTYPSARVANGTEIVAYSWIDGVWKLAFEERISNSQLSFIGWPTVDGGCGSDIYIWEPLGIFSHTNLPEACLKFIKFSILNVERDNPSKLPVYTPYLKSLVEQAVQEKPFRGVQMTNEDANRFFALLATIKDVAIYDEIVLNIITDEASTFFSGSKTAESAAEIIERRVQLYLSEQFS